MKIRQKTSLFVIFMFFSLPVLACNLFQPASSDGSGAVVITGAPVSPTTQAHAEAPTQPPAVTITPRAGGGLTPTAASTQTPDSPLPTGVIIEPISRFEAGIALHSVDFSPDGSQLAVGSDDAAYLWDVGSGQVLYTLDRQPGEVVTTYATFSPDGRLLATCGGGTRDEPIIQLWDFDFGELLLTFEGPYDYINAIAFSPDGRILAAGGGPQDNVVNLYEADTGKLLKTLWHNRFVLSVSFNPIGNTLASAGGDAAAHIWDLDSGEELFTLTGSKDNITDLAWSPDGDKLVAASLDGAIRVWEPVSSRGMQVLGEIGGESLLSVAWMPDSGIIAAGGDLGTLYLWDQDSNQLLMQITQAHQDAINSLKFSPTDRLLATGGADGLVKLWRLQ